MLEISFDESYFFQEILGIMCFVANVWSLMCALLTTLFWWQMMNGTYRVLTVCSIFLCKFRSIFL